MRIVVLSDIHYGNDAHSAGGRPFSKKAHKEFAARAHSEKPDVLLVCGDVADTVIGKELLAKCLDTYRNPHGASLFVTGNHDVWYRKRVGYFEGFPVFEGVGFDDAEEKYHWHGREADRHGWTFLKDEPWELDGVWFLGNMGWYDFSSAPPELGMTPERYEAQRRFSDYVAMGYDSGPDQTPMLSFCSRRMDELKVAASKLPHYRRRNGLVVATHVVGFPELMGPIRDYYSAFFGNYSIGEDVVRGLSPDYYCCGHTHSHVDGYISGIRCINNGSDYGLGEKRYDVLEIP